MMAALPRRDRVVLVTAMVLSTMPMWLVQTPPLTDLLGHMGRYHLQLSLDHSPDLQRHWELHWMLIGNLGIDLIMQVLGRLFGVERGAWLVAIAIPPLMIWGMVRLQNAYHRAVPPTIVAAFPFVLAYTYQVGLVNFWLAVALAFHASASVIGSPERWARPVLLAISAVALWITHIFGWAIFCGIVATDRLFERENEPFWRRFADLWPLAAPILLMLYQNYGEHESAKTLGWFEWHHKRRAFWGILRSQDRLFDQWSLIACLVPAALALVMRKTFRLARRPMLAAIGLGICAALLPYQLFGSAFADARLFPVVLMLVAIAVVPRPDAGKWATLVLPGLLFGLFAVRVAVDTLAFKAYDADYQRQLAMVENVPKGSRVAYFVRIRCDREWARTRLEHLDGLAIVRRDVFTNGQWEIPGAETVSPLAAKGTWANSDPSQMVRMRICRDDMVPRLSYMLSQLPRDRFDYVWVMDFSPKALPLYPGLEPLYATDKAILYRINRP